MNLPNEIINIIINFIDPNETIFAAMVCKQWKNLLDNRKYDYLVTYFNDSYAVSKIKSYSIEDSDLILFINKIITPNCLNIIAYNSIHKNRTFSEAEAKLLIKQFCKTNNINLQFYIKFDRTLPRQYIINKILKWSLINDSYNISDFILAFGPDLHDWVKYIVHKYNKITNNIKRSLTYLLNNHAINLPVFYVQMLSLKNKSSVCYDIAKYIKYNVNENIRFHIKQNNIF